MTDIIIFPDPVQAPSFVGNLTGNVTGNLVGTHTGNVTGNLTGNSSGLHSGAVINGGTNIAGDGSIVVPSGDAVFYITKGSAAAITLPNPTAGTDDYKRLWIHSETAFAHVITCAGVGFNGKGASGTLTYGGAKGDSVCLMARGGNWWVYAPNNVVAA